jgi:molybdenum cofactor cytidylyltransferase
MMTAIVLAAGLSRRMGEVNKLLLPFGKKTVLETTLDNILSSNIDVVLIVIGHEAPQVKKVLDDYLRRNTGFRRKFFIVENPDFEQGMTTSIQAGVKASQYISPTLHSSQPSITHNSELITHNSINYMICLSDMPLISADEYSFLKNQFDDILKQDEKAIIQPIFKEKRGNPTIFSSFYENDILNLVDTEGCKPIVQAHKNHVHVVEMTTPSILKDIDNKEDYFLVKNE